MEFASTHAHTRFVIPSWNYHWFLFKFFVLAFEKSTNFFFLIFCSILHFGFKKKTNIMFASLVLHMPLNGVWDKKHKIRQISHPYLFICWKNWKRKKYTFGNEPFGLIHPSTLHPPPTQFGYTHQKWATFSLFCKSCWNRTQFKTKKQWVYFGILFIFQKFWTLFFGLSSFCHLEDRSTVFLYYLVLDFP